MSVKLNPDYMLHVELTGLIQDATAEIVAREQRRAVQLDKLAAERAEIENALRDLVGTLVFLDDPKFGVKDLGGAIYTAYSVAKKVLEDVG
jgi:hypothetical protein